MASVKLHSRPDVAICSRCLDWLVMRRDRQVAARSGGWRVGACEPVFTVADVARSVDHYTRLGFAASRHDETSAVARRAEDLTIHLVRSETASGGPGGSIYLDVDDPDQVAEEWRKAGLEVVGPADADGRREGSHADPDGNLLRFGSPRPGAAPD